VIEKLVELGFVSSPLSSPYFLYSKTNGRMITGDATLAALGVADGDVLVVVRN
jgi:uncharacterized ubiquitin-like protein YukD